MICFQDTTYCNNPKCDGSCGRQWTEKLQREAERWWGGPHAPVAFADLHPASDWDSGEVQVDD